MAASTLSSYERLRGPLRELFQFDRAFGLYHIMNQRRTENRSAMARLLGKLAGRSPRLAQPLPPALQP